MSKFLLLVKQLYSQKAKSKSFILMTALYLVVISAVVFWPEIKAIFSNDEATQYAIINETDVDLSSAFVSTDGVDWNIESSMEVVKTKVEDNEYLAAVQLTEQDNKLLATIISNEPLKLTNQNELQGIITAAGQFYAMGKINLTDAQAAILLDFEPIISSETLADANSEGKTSDEKQAGIIVSYVAGFLIYFFVVTYLSMITTDIASEKGSRALEMLLVSVKPETHFKAKIVGVLLVAFTQLGTIALFVVALVTFSKGGELWTSVQGVLNDLNSSYLIYSVLFLLSTIILFLIIGALFGSLVSKVEEASQVMTPAILITVVGFYIMVTGVANPDTLLIKVASYIPLTSGMVMPMRIGATDLNAIEPLISLVLLIGTIIVLYFVTIMLYKRSVLTYSSGGIIQKLKSVFKYTT